MHFLKGTVFEQVQGFILKILKLEKNVYIKITSFDSLINFKGFPHSSSVIDCLEPLSRCK